MDLNKLFHDSFVWVDHRRTVGGGCGDGDGFGYGYGEACGAGSGIEGCVGGDHNENAVFKDNGYDGFDVNESSFEFDFGNDFGKGEGHGSGSGNPTTSADGSGGGYRRRS